MGLCLFGLPDVGLILRPLLCSKLILYVDISRRFSRRDFRYFTSIFSRRDCIILCMKGVPKLGTLSVWPTRCRAYVAAGFVIVLRERVLPSVELYCLRTFVCSAFSSGSGFC